MTTKERSQSDECEVSSKLDGSIVSYPKRCNLFGESHYRGNCDGRLVASLILHYGAKRVADPMEGSGTTGDVVRWLNSTRGLNLEYWGGDLRSGFDAVKDPIPGEFDLIWVHPPYYDIIQYGTDSRDLSNSDSYDDFTYKLGQMLENCARSLVTGGRLAVLVGDVRKKGRYIPIVDAVLSMEPRLGQLRSIIIKAQHNVTSDRKSYHLEDPRIMHEYCVVLKRVENSLN